tara:strand:- start:24 stop:347 length:324 start_codon:yes stop_codon:yes gene_type:complete
MPNLEYKIYNEDDELVAKGGLFNILQLLINLGYKIEEIKEIGMTEFIKLKDAVNNLYNNLIDAEITNYMETFEEDDPTKKSTNQLKKSNYKDLRILRDFITEKEGER